MVAVNAKSLETYPSENNYPSEDQDYEYSKEHDNKDRSKEDKKK